MIIFKFDIAKEKLRNRDFTDQKILPYFIIFFLLYSNIFFDNVGTTVNSWDYLSGILSSMVSVLGIVYAYKCNGGSDGYDFIQKFVIINLIVFIRCIFFILLFMFFAVIIGNKFGFINNKASTIYDVIILVIVEVFFFQRIGHHIRDTIKIVSSE